jgi:hypothetical protein
VTDTRWTRYAFTLPGDDEPNFIGSAVPLDCEVTIGDDGAIVVHLDASFRLNNRPTLLNQEQLLLLLAKVNELKAKHQEGDE